MVVNFVLVVTIRKWRSRFCCWLVGVALLVGGSLAASKRAHAYELASFTTKQLSDVYFSEGATAGDINGDGQTDVVCGPYWYEGPSFEQKHEIYRPVAQDRERYADHFFSWIDDINDDGRNDVLVVGFPGTPAYVYQNPGSTQNSSLGSQHPDAKNRSQHWPKHQVLDWVSNESPQYTNIVGDERPELVCTRDGFFGFATCDPDEPFSSWTFHPISEQIAPKRFGHGLGVGDIDGDGRKDLIYSGGWFQQPRDDALSKRWKLHSTSFSNSYGGAEMYAYDVDGDGDNDVITSHAAHDFGLAWYEQTQASGEINFEHHLIMGDRPEQSRYGVVFSELHSVNLVDIDGDGLKDIVTGKTYWSHHRQSPMWNADPVVYWFRLVRSTDGVDWIPFLAGTKSGIGRQLSVYDVNGDHLPDIVVGGMKGAHVLTQSRQPVDKSVWLASQPQEFIASAERTDRGQPPAEFQDGAIPGAIEAESMQVLRLTGGTTRIQDMSGFKQAIWSGGKQLFWSGANPDDQCTLEFHVAQHGTYDVAAVLTTARDYGTVHLQLDGTTIGAAIDLYDYPDVQTTGVLTLGTRTLQAGQHTLQIEITGANDSAVKGYMAGLDCLILSHQ